MPVPVSRTVRLHLDLVDRLERLRQRTEEQAGVPVDLRTVLERIVDRGLSAAEQPETVDAPTGA